MTKGVQEIVVKLYDENDVCYAKKSVFTKDIADGVGWGWIESHLKKEIIEVLNDAYDHEFNGTEPPADYSEFKIWKTVKNINTDDELEEIADALDIPEDYR